MYTYAKNNVPKIVFSTSMDIHAELIYVATLPVSKMME